MHCIHSDELKRQNFLTPRARVLYCTYSRRESCFDIITLLVSNCSISRLHNHYLPWPVSIEAAARDSLPNSQLRKSLFYTDVDMISSKPNPSWFSSALLAPRQATSLFVAGKPCKRQTQLQPLQSLQYYLFQAVSTSPHKQLQT